ncbi:MAG: sodium/proton-translocating pyrophosphatase, partial [Oscillospiraceae bacterium]|nr:sodium/proton-translocating pyrophosphatase [Oscillospiraceae bacterium]
MENYFWVGIVGAVIALLFAYSQARKVKQYSEGTPLMQKIAAAIRKGANAYLKRQYKTVGLIFAIIAVVLAVLAFVPWINGQGLVSKFVPFAFVTGGFYSCLAGFIGMRIATSSNARTANAASESLNRGLRVAISSGSVMGFTVVGQGILDVSVWFLVLKYGFGCDSTTIANTMVMFGMGAS